MRPSKCTVKIAFLFPVTVPERSVTVIERTRTLYNGHKIKRTLKDAAHYRTPRDARVTAFESTVTVTGWSRSRNKNTFFTVSLNL